MPTNPIGALADAKMLQVVFFALMLGIALTRLSRRVEGTTHVIKVFQLLSDAIIEMVQLIMKIAPLGVFAMLAAVVADLGKDPAQLGDLLTSLGGYMATVVVALFVHYLVVYTALLKLLTNVPWRKFAKAMVPAQLLAFSSSSSAATLPVTIKSVEEGVGVDEEVSSFVLPLGATINMDGTGLYQGVAAVFIANALGVPLDLGQQLMIVLTAALASIGTAAVPGVGIVMLVIVLKQVGLPEAVIGLILAVERPLDMCRTVLNVTGDATVATIVASSEGLIHDGERAMRRACDEVREDPHCLRRWAYRLAQWVNRGRFGYQDVWQRLHLAALSAGADEPWVNRVLYRSFADSLAQRSEPMPLSVLAGGLH